MVYREAFKGGLPGISNEKKKERSQTKLKNVLKQKGCQSGKAPKGKVAHHVKPVAEGGKTTVKNIRVVPVGKHKRIHANRRAQGKI